MRMIRPSHSTASMSLAFLRLGLLSLALVMVLAPAASACQMCQTISLPWWPYQGVMCGPALGPGYEGCYHDNYGFFCQTYGDPCSGGGPACFLAGTMISTPDGDRCIETLQVGDAIWCVGENGERIAGKITQTTRDVSNGYYRLNGSTRVTGAHRFLTTRSGQDLGPSLVSTTYEQHALGEWTPVQDLTLGQQLRTIDGGSVNVETIEFVNRGVRVFNLEVAPHHNYFADGILVHNRKPDPNNP